MLNMKYTRIFNTESRAVETGCIIHEEGMALVETIEAGETKVKLSTGAAGEIFAGISLSRNAPPATLSNVETGLVPTTLQVKLQRVPKSGQLLVKVGSTVLDIVTSGAPAAGEVLVAGEFLTFNTAQLAGALFVQYLYEPTLSEARAVIGDMPIGGLASSAQHVIGVLTRAECSTNMFDASVDWSAAVQVKLGPNGTFTTTGSGTTIPNATIRSRPSAANSLLTLAIN